MGERRIQLVGANADLFEARETEVLLCGPAGTGKTHACLWRLHTDLLRYAGSRALLARDTRVSLTNSALVTYENHILPPGSPIAQGAGRANRKAYQYPNGSVLVVGGLEKDYSLFSTEWDLVYVQEAQELTLNKWESLLRSLRNHRMPTQQLIGDCNPDHPKHWLKLRCDAGLTRLITGTHQDNPAYVDPKTGEETPKGRAYLSKLRQLTGVRKERLLHGRWAASEGVVYEGFTDAHVIDPFPIPDDWRRICSVDFGYTNPFTAQWWAIDGDGRYYLYREVYGVKRLVSAWAAEIKRLTGDERIEAHVCDHDAEDRATLHSAGLRTVRAVKSIRPGIDKVVERFKVAGDGKPRIFFFRDSLVARDEELHEARQPCSVVEEIPGYVWPKGLDGKPLKELPSPGPDHGCDAMRYAVAWTDLKRVAQVY